MILPGVVWVECFRAASMEDMKLWRPLLTELKPDCKGCCGWRRSANVTNLWVDVETFPLSLNEDFESSWWQVVPSLLPDISILLLYRSDWFSISQSKQTIVDAKPITLRLDERVRKCFCVIPATDRREPHLRFAVISISRSVDTLLRDHILGMWTTKLQSLDRTAQLDQVRHARRIGINWLRVGHWGIAVQALKGTQGMNEVSLTDWKRGTRYLQRRCGLRWK